MTALSGPILFNNSTGSDTAASGCGPATAISVMMQTSAGSNVATASWSGTISAGDLMYIPDSSFTGRKFNVVAVVGSGTLTFDDNWDDSSFGTSGYVGGKRATFDHADSRRLFDADSDLNWIIETETDQSISSAITVSAAYLQLRGANDTQRTITQSADAVHLSVGVRMYLSHLKFQNSNASKTNAFAFTHTVNYVAPQAYRCVFGDATNKLASACSQGSVNYQTIIFYQCEVVHCVSHGIPYWTNGTFFLNQCLVDSNGGSGTAATHNSNRMTVTSSIFSNNTDDGILVGNSPANAFGCVFYNNGRDGYNCAYGAGAFQNCIFHSNGRYGIGALYTSGFVEQCVFYNNTTADMFSTYYYQESQSSQQRDSITLTADPFVDAANGDFNLNADAGGGATLRSTNYTLGG